MLTEKQIDEIREHLESAQNPVFFFDNDIDGLCSYVLLRRFVGRGKGVAVKSHPGIDSGYARKVQELGGDYVFVLDKPHLGEKFVSEIKDLSLPIVWIDHHDVDNSYEYDNLHIYNPTKNKDKMKSDEPVTYLSYKISNKEEDLWIAMMGCIADRYMPDFKDKFAENYPELWKKVKDPFEAFYKTDIGYLARAVGYGIKDSITHVVQLQNLIVNAKSPSDVLAELESKSAFGNKVREITKKYEVLIEDAKKSVSEKLIFFSYGGDMSISSEISNELSFLYPSRFIVVAYTGGGPLSNLSIRGKNVKKILERLLGSFENASGGGHNDAVGARIQTSDLERFKEEFKNELNK